MSSGERRIEAVLISAFLQASFFVERPSLRGSVFHQSPSGQAAGYRGKGAAESADQTDAGIYHGLFRGNGNVREQFLDGSGIGGYYEHSYEAAEKTAQTDGVHQRGFGD